MGNQVRKEPGVNVLRKLFNSPGLGMHSQRAMGGDFGPADTAILFYFKPFSMLFQDLALIGPKSKIIENRTI